MSSGSTEDSPETQAAWNAMVKSACESLYGAGIIGELGGEHGVRSHEWDEVAAALRAALVAVTEEPCATCGGDGPYDPTYCEHSYYEPGLGITKTHAAPVVLQAAGVLAGPVLVWNGNRDDEFYRVTEVK